jgi:ADP-ribosylglycohydrolase
VTFKFTHNFNKEMPAAECLMRITPLAVWGYKLTPEELFEAVRLVTSFTNSSEKAVEATYLYCYALV